MKQPIQSQTFLSLLMGLFLLSTPGWTANAPSLCFDFEEGTLQGWVVVEGQFDRVVCDWDFFHNNPDTRYNKQGKFYLNTLEKSDGSRTDSFVGIIESPVFRMEGAHASFLVGGGNHPDTYVALCHLDGSEIVRANGKNSETMQVVEWDLAPLKGQSVFLRLVDHNPGGWGHLTFDNFQAEGTIDEEATRQRFLQREQEIRQKQITQIKEELQSILTSSQSAIQDLQQTDADRYPHGDRYQTQLTEFREKVNQLSWEESDNLRKEIQQFQRAALLENPALSAQPILFVARNQYVPDHHSTATLFQNGEINTASFRGGSALKLLDLQTGETKTLIDCPQGIVRDPEIHFDGKRVIFSMRQSIADDYHIYELTLVDKSLRQITFGAQLSDFDPIYLPNDDILFASTREPKYCQCNRHIMGNLFRMNAQGDNIEQLGRNTLFEGHPCLLPDGRILYDRWEYVDKHFGPAFGLWTMNPDGTNHAIFYGNNAWAPGAILDARAIPDTEWVVATFGSCHDRPWGAIAIVDRQRGMDGVEPVVHSWPADIKTLITDSKAYGDGTSRNHPVGGQIDNFVRLPIKYEDPFPLSDRYFLCSRIIEGERTGIFLLDVFGNEICLHEEKETGCFDPMPIKPSARPNRIPSRVDHSKKEGYVYVSDVYQGSGMQNVQPGTIKTLRIVEAPVKLYWTQTNWNLDATQAPAMNFNSTNNKRILGDIPVEDDGSAYFAMPADTFVFFQLLDEKGRMVQSMRSGTMVRPGEMQGCVGCHENRLTAASNLAPQAIRRQPRTIQPWYGPARDFNYLTEVQPVFDRYCVSCHDYNRPAGDVLNLCGDLGLVFNTSYLELRRKSALRWYQDAPDARKLLVKAVDDGPPEALSAYAWGSHRSRLVDVIQSEHQGLVLDRESQDRIITWIDMNAPYYGSYASVYPDNVFGRSPLDDRQIEALRQLTGIQVGDISTELQGSQCDFTRPEFSPCLQALKKSNPENYEKALQIIQQGKKQLEQKPRMDMPNAQLLEPDRQKLNKYLARKQAEQQTQSNLTSNNHQTY